MQSILPHMHTPPQKKLSASQYTSIFHISTPHILETEGLGGVF